MSSFFKKFIIIPVFTSFFLFSVTLTYAQLSPGGGGSGINPGSGGTSGLNTGSGGCGSGGTGLSNPLGDKCDLYKLIEAVVDKVFLPIGGVLAVFFIIYSGFLLVTSAGNEEKLKTGKKTLMWTLIGSAILLGSWVIAKGIENTVKDISRPAYRSSQKEVALVLPNNQNSYENNF